MRHINTLIHPDVAGKENLKTFERTAARAVVTVGNDILLIYTKRYDDYTIPGGGVDESEPIKEALKRELHEETGANNVKVISHFGTYEEYRPYYKGYDQMHMISHIFVCNIDEKLGDAKPEEYEKSNGSVPVWVDIDKAIKHNEEVINSNPESMGLSIIREYELLKLIKEELMKKDA
ncbi:MAG: NUDIX domain-containing protein [Firmicutes bacterium]|jgi:ADP-ribose pyrophosphatase YjhB (NUDIX family)|nr:NUDIX domain-containing protein [Bacillota bacterium]